MLGDGDPGYVSFNTFPSYFLGSMPIVQATYLRNAILPGKFKILFNAVPLMEATWKSCSFHAELKGYAAAVTV